MNERGPIDCGRARELCHAVLDGDLMEAARRRQLDVHLEGCSGCREFDADLRAIQTGLRRLPGTQFPDGALEAVWERTVRAPRPGSGWFEWRAAAAAAVLTAAFLGLGHWSRPPREASPGPEQVARAADEARLVLKLTAQALSKAERVAMREIVDEVSPALQRVPIRWSPRLPDDGGAANGV